MAQRRPSWETGTVTFPKPRSRKAEQRRQKAHRRTVIAAVRNELVHRDTRCRVCGDAFSEGLGAAQMHEVKSRARLRGRPPEDIFNTDNCILVCNECHTDIHAHRIELTPLGHPDERGHYGRLRFAIKTRGRNSHLQRTLTK